MKKVGQQVSATEEEFIICFDSAALAIMAEQAFLENKFYVRVMPKPSAIKEGCGFCLRFLPDTFESVLAFLSKREIKYTGCYRMSQVADGSVSYIGF
jgi:hypothetical protein